ncbi:MAG: hypothetical protein ABIY48_04360, partial [Acidimicrobiales bacterium]
MTEAQDGPEPGAGLVNLAFVGTGLLVGTSVGAALLPDAFGLLHAVLSGVLFAVGTGAFLWAYALGVSRSRVDLVTISGLFFLAGETAPASVRRPLRVAVALEVVAVLVAAGVRPYTEAAFGILAPMFAMGLMGVWGGRHGSFPPRPPTSSRLPRAADPSAD